MTTLKEILELTWTVTELDVTVREPNGHFIKQYISELTASLESEGEQMELKI